MSSLIIYFNNRTVVKNKVTMPPQIAKTLSMYIKIPSQFPKHSLYVYKGDMVNGQEQLIS